MDSGRCRRPCPVARTRPLSPARLPALAIYKVARLRALPSGFFAGTSWQAAWLDSRSGVFLEAFMATMVAGIVAGVVGLLTDVLLGDVLSNQLRGKAFSSRSPRGFLRRATLAPVSAATARVVFRRRRAGNQSKFFLSLWGIIAPKRDFRTGCNCTLAVSPGPDEGVRLLSRAAKLFARWTVLKVPPDQAASGRP